MGLSDRPEGEILSTVILEDDGCDYLPSIIWEMRSRASLKHPYKPKPKPVYCGADEEAIRRSPKKCHVGKRRSYSRAITLLIYQLHRQHVNEAAMSEKIGVPVEDIRRILAHKTDMQKQLWVFINQQPFHAIPRIPEIMRRLEKEISRDKPSRKAVQA